MKIGAEGQEASMSDEQEWSKRPRGGRKDQGGKGWGGEKVEERIGRVVAG